MALVPAIHGVLYPNHMQDKIVRRYKLDATLPIPMVREGFGRGDISKASDYRAIGFITISRNIKSFIFEIESGLQKQIVSLEKLPAC